jgi:hypothetical protein
MEQLQPLADSESPFFRLPREIRDQIYGHIWKDTCKIRQWYKQKHYTVTYDLGSTAQEKLPLEKALWLLANKQMLHEGLQELHQRSEWHFEGSLGETRPKYYVLPSMTPTQARTHHIVVSGLQPLEFDTERRIYSLKQSTFADLNESALSASAVNTVSVYMTRAVSEPEFANTARHFTFDLAKLEQLVAHTSMRKFQVLMAEAPRKPHMRAAQWKMRDLVRSHLFEAYYELKLQHELRRVGRLLVEGGAESWSVVETRPAGDYDEGGVCWIFTIKKS